MPAHRPFVLWFALVAAPVGCAGGDDSGSGGGGGDVPWSGDGEAGDFALSLDVNGVNRTFFLHAPASAVDVMPDGPVPLLLLLHGAGDTGENFATAAQLTDLADDNGFLVAAPDAVKKAWFLSSSEGWPGADGNNSSFTNDLDLMLAIVDSLDQDYHIDHDRMFTAGFSRGAAMSAALATVSNQHDLAVGTYVSPFAAHAVSAGYDVYNGALDFTETQPQNPVWVLHGTADQGVPYSMGKQLADDLEAAGWDVTFTSIPDAPHNWLFQAGYGQTNQDMWDWFLEKAQ